MSVALNATSSYYSYTHGEVVSLGVLWVLSTAVTMVCGGVVSALTLCHPASLLTPSNIILISLYISDIFSLLVRVPAQLTFTQHELSGDQVSGDQVSDQVSVSGMGAVYMFSHYTTYLHMLLPAVYVFTWHLHACERYEHRRFKACFRRFKTTLYVFTAWYVSFLLNVPLFSDAVVYLYEGRMMRWHYAHHHPQARGQHVWYQLLHNTVAVVTVATAAVLYVLVILKRSRIYHYILTQTMNARVHPEEGTDAGRHSSATTTSSRATTSATSSTSSQRQLAQAGPSTSIGVSHGASRDDFRMKLGKKSYETYFRKVVSTIEDEDIVADPEAGPREDGREENLRIHATDDMRETVKQYLFIFLPFMSVWLLNHLFDTITSYNRTLVTTTHTRQVTDTTVYWHSQVSPEAAKFLNALIQTLWILSYTTHFIAPLWCQARMRAVLGRWRKKWKAMRQRSDSECRLDVDDKDKDEEDEEEEEEEGLQA